VRLSSPGRIAEAAWFHGDVAHPLNAQMREKLERTVLAEYAKAARDTHAELE